MSHVVKSSNITLSLVHKLINDQFPEFNHLSIESVKQQGHDNRTFRLGENMLVRMPTAECYALAIEKEQKFLPFIASFLSVKIPRPLKMGHPTKDFPFPFSIYTWLEGESLNHIKINAISSEHIASDLATFLKKLHYIDITEAPPPGIHNWHRGAHIDVYDTNARSQIKNLEAYIDVNKANALWGKALHTRWKKTSCMDSWRSYRR